MCSNQRFSKFLAISFLVLGTFFSAYAAQDSEQAVIELKPGLAANPAKRDNTGNLLPNISYDEFITRGMNFVMNEQDTWFKGPRLSDENGVLPPYFHYAHTKMDGTVIGKEPGHEAVYPARHFSQFIEAFIRYYNYTGDRKCIDISKRIADFLIARHTPSDWLYGNLPYSTHIQLKPGGFKDADTLNTNKPGLMSLSYIKLGRVTGEKKYIKAANDIADTLARTQLPEGDWPFRVNPQTGKVQQAYSSSLIYAVMLFDTLDQMNKNSKYEANRNKALEWIIKYPAQTMDWKGWHEDIPDKPENRNVYDVTDTVDYFVLNRDKDPRYMELAMKLNAFIDDTFIRRYHYFYPAEAVAEQLVCNFTMGHHTMHYAVELAHLEEAKPGQGYKQRAQQMMNFCTYLMQPDNSIVTGPEFERFWYGVHFGTVNWMMQVIGVFPEFAPAGENHLLSTSAAVTNISYEDDRIIYSTDQYATDSLRIRFKKPRITVNGDAVNISGNEFNAETGVLRFSHPAGKIIIADSN